MQKGNSANQFGLSTLLAFFSLIENQVKCSYTIAHMFGKSLKPALVSFAAVYSPTMAVILFDPRARPSRAPDWLLGLLLGPGIGPSYLLLEFVDLRIGTLGKLAEEFYLIVPIAIISIILVGLTLMGTYGPRWLWVAAVFGLGIGCFSAWVIYNLARAE